MTKAEALKVPHRSLYSFVSVGISKPKNGRIQAHLLEMHPDNSLLTAIPKGDHMRPSSSNQIAL